MTTHYCATCRVEFVADETPPYSVVHLIGGGHLHPITREPVTWVVTL